MGKNDMCKDKNGDKVKALIKKIARDERLACRVRQASLDEMIKIAEDNGIHITRKELKRAIESQGDKLETVAEEMKKEGIKGSNKVRAFAEWSG